MLCLFGAPAVATGAAGEVDEAVRLVRSEAGSQRLILLGEKHGTREIPDLVEALVAAYATDGPVLLGLEVPREEHDALRRYLDSNGSEAARRGLRSGRFWQVDSDQHDGRRSEDMLDLIEAMRGLRADGRDVASAPAQMQTPMGQHLRDLDPFAIVIRAREGEFWACTTHCEAMDVVVKTAVSGPVRGGFFAGVYDLQVVLPRFSVARLLTAP